MPFLAHAPCAPLAPFVQSFWLYEGELTHALERVLPQPSLQLLVNLDEDSLRCRRGADWERENRIGGIGLVGIRTGPAAIDTRQQRRIAGVAFRPGGAWPFFREPMSAALDSELDLTDLWGPQARSLRDGLLEARTGAGVLHRLEAALLERYDGQLPAARTAEAMRALEEGARVDETALRLGVTPATLRRRFLTNVGVSPKVFARLARLRRTLTALSQAAPPSWAAFALDQGFVDQSHLIRELRTLGGLTPTEYLPRSPGETSHVVID